MRGREGCGGVGGVAMESGGAGGVARGWRSGRRHGDEGVGEADSDGAAAKGGGGGGEEWKMRVFLRK